MKLLLDTHVFLWWRLSSRRLKRDARQAIVDADVVWVSAASAWEIAIKQGLGRIRLDDPFSALVADSLFTELPVTMRHTERLSAIPAHHTDPFDRMLVAQAATEGATLVTHDRQFEGYGVPVVWT
ncbi:MAG: type II toxin-antitoxin system VapC family toxin [Vicinamibacterales bacterium]